MHLKRRIISGAVLCVAALAISPFFAAAQTTATVIPSAALVSFVTTSMFGSGSAAKLPAATRASAAYKIASEIAASGKAPSGFTGPLASTTAATTAGGAGGNCFDYYHFQSVQVNVAAPVGAAPAGTELQFKGTLENQNTYPIVDGQIYVKIFKKNSNAAEVAQNANDLIDQFVAQTGITLAAGEKRPVSIAWTPPATLAAGSYTAAFFFETAERFNLLGLSFEDDVVGNVADFTIQGAATGNVSFDKNSVTMNGKAFHFAQPIPQFASTTPVTISAKLVNPLAKAATATVTWTTYIWDALQAKNVVDTHQEKVTVPAHASTAVSYVENKNKSSVSYVIADAVADGVHSILDTRFARTGYEYPRINFPSVTAYPLTAGQQNTLFSCYHAAGLDVPGSTLTLTLADMQGNTITSATYDGTIKSAMSVLAKAFTPSATYTDFTLRAVLAVNGKVVDDVTSAYRCADIDPALCTHSTSPFPLSTEAMGIAAVVILIAIVGYVVMRRRQPLP